MPFTIERNDLAAVGADAIVVAANEQLQITGGVGMAVARAAGFEKLQTACDAVGFCPCGSAVATPAFGLKAKMVVHAVGPVWQGGGRGEADLLLSAYGHALDCAAAGGASSVALPLISAGTYGFPADISLAVARESIRAFLNEHDGIDVRLVLHSRQDVAAGMAAYLSIAEYIDDTYVDERLERSDRLELRSMTLGDDALAPQAATTPSAARDDRSLKKRAGRPRRAAKVDEADKAAGDDKTIEIVGNICAAPFDTGLFPPDMAGAPEEAAGLARILETLDAPFSTTLLALIDQRGLTDAQVYKRANMSRQLFSKIRSDASYRPTKKTALALAVALELSLDETNDLLARAGFALSRSSKADVIVEYFIAHGNHDIFQINEALYAFDQPLL